MHASRRYPIRLVVALAAAALVLVIGAVAAFGQGSARATGVAVGSGIAAPGWCCGTDGSVPGLTTVGQATLRGQGQAARDTAIAAAVQDAMEQAKAAADAAGITLGPIVDLQVSGMPYIYPMMGAVGSAPGSPGSGGTEPAPGPVPAPNMYVGSVSVTITWSLG